MASRPKRKYTSTCEQEELMRQYYEGFDKDEEIFLGRRFIDSDDGNNDLVFRSASDDSDNGEISNVTVVDAPESGDEEEMEEHDELIEDPIELPKKQKFKNLDTVLNEDNYAAFPPEENRKFLYSNAKKTVIITWNTVSDQNVHQRGAENIFKNVPGMRGVAKYAKTPVKVFTLFFTKSMIKNIVRYTNAVIQPAIERFSDLFEQSDKYPHFRLIDQLDVEPFIGILYLQAVLEQ